MTKIAWAAGLSLLGALVPGASGAQELSAGSFVRSFSFDPGIGARRVTQWGVPLGARVWIGRRAAFSISAAWASAELASYDGWVQRFAGLTDAQAGLSYVLGRDLAVITVTGNIPSGAAPSTIDRAVIGATGSSMLAFPVTDFRSGPAATGALAVARRWGGVNIGLGAGVRWAGAFRPVRDEPSRFAPALEGRLHVGADGLVAGGRLAVSGAISTFTHDEFARTSVDAGSERRYRPGRRSVLELDYVAPLGSRTLGLSAWVFVSGAPRDSAVADSASKDVIGNISASLAVPIGSGVTVSPRVEFRRGWGGGDHRDRLLSAELGWAVAVGSGVQLFGSGRYDTGRITAEATGAPVAVKGIGLTVGLRRGT
jgi:hypothetical protein